MAGPKYKRVQKDDPDSSQMYEQPVQHGRNSGSSSSRFKETEKVQIITTAAEYGPSNSGIAKKDLICYTSCITTAVITSYFVLSITLTFYNQWIFKVLLIQFVSNSILETL